MACIVGLWHFGQVSWINKVKDMRVSFRARRTEDTQTQIVRILGALRWHLNRITRCASTVTMARRDRLDLTGRSALPSRFPRWSSTSFQAQARYFRFAPDFKRIAVSQQTGPRADIGPEYGWIKRLCRLLLRFSATDMEFSSHAAQQQSGLYLIYAGFGT